MNSQRAHTLHFSSSNGSLPVSEMFHSIQGEGRSVGKPFLFIRFAGCNLQCSWCDTKYSWHPDQLDFTWIEFAEIQHWIQATSIDTGCKNILFTGGEPLLHQDHIRRIQEAFPSYIFEVETNGSFKTDLIFDQIVVSYKLSNAGNTFYDLQIHPSDNVIYKFVVTSEEDLEEIFDLQKKYNLPTQSIYLMPEGSDVRTLNKRSTWVVDKCLKFGFNYSSRLHILLWGNRRGV